MRRRPSTPCSTLSYLPKSRTADPEEHPEAGVPDAVGFAANHSWLDGWSRLPRPAVFRVGGLPATKPTAVTHVWSRHCGATGQGTIRPYH